MRTHRLVAGLTLVTQLAACTTWRLQDVSPQQLLSEEQPKNILVTRTDGKWLHLQYPRVANDSLLGFDYYRVGRVVRGVPLSRVQYVQVKKTNWLTTGLAVGLPLAFLVAVAVSMPDCMAMSC